MSQTRAKYLKEQIQRLQSVITHLENAGVEIYNNRSPCIFEETTETTMRRQHEKHPPEIFHKTGEDFLVEFKETLQIYEDELAELNI